jgi:heptose I phosphotransferase
MTDTFWQRLARGVRRVRQRPDWTQFAGPDWEERIMAMPVTDRFHAKQGRSIGRWIVEGPDRNLAVYLKRHYRLPRWRGLLAAFWPDAGWSPALQEWRHLEWAKAKGLPVPAALAAAEYIGPWGRLQSVLAVEELAGMVPLHEAIPAAAQRLDPRTFGDWKRGLAVEMAHLTRELHRRRCFHKDLYLCHFYVRPEELPAPAEWVGRVHLIDLHRLAHHPWTWRWWQVKDLAQLLYSSVIVGVSARDRLRFWRAYLGPQQRTWSTWWLRRLVLVKWRRYRRHNEKHRGRRGSGF